MEDQCQQLKGATTLPSTVQLAEEVFLKAIIGHCILFRNDSNLLKHRALVLCIPFVPMNRSAEVTDSFMDYVFWEYR
jgi:hypothetical protein